MLFKATETEIQLDEKDRILEGYLSIFNNIDLGGDVVLPGAFDETIKMHGPEGGDFIKHFYWHEHLIGPMLELRPDKKGLWYRGKVLPTEKGNECWLLVQGKALKHNSFAYDVAEELGKDEDPKEYGAPEGGKRYLKKVRMYEGGPVPWPMNELADLTAAKALFGRLPEDIETITRLQKELEELKSEVTWRDGKLDELEREVRSLTGAIRAAGRRLPLGYRQSQYLRRTG